MNELIVGVRMQSEDKVPTYCVYLYDDIEKYGHIDLTTWEYKPSETSADHIREVLEDIPAGAEIDVHINSNGGLVSEATAIASLLRQHEGRTVGIVDGVAHSAAFTVLQGCGHRVMYSGTQALIHNAFCDVSGDAAELRRTADQLDQIMDSVVGLYMERAAISEKELRDLMDKSTVLTPETALKYGLIDEIATGTPDLSAWVPTGNDAPAETDPGNDEDEPAADMKNGFAALFN